MSEFVKLPSGYFLNMNSVEMIYPYTERDSYGDVIKQGIGISWSDGGADTFVYGSDAESMLNYLNSHSYAIPEVPADDECPF